MKGFNVTLTAPTRRRWRIAAVLPDNAVQILCVSVICDPRHPFFLGARTCTNNIAELTGFTEAIRWARDIVSRGERVLIFTTPITLHEWLWVKRSSTWLTDAMPFCYATTTEFSFRCIMFLATPAMLEMSVRTLRHPLAPTVYVRV